MPDRQRDITSLAGISESNKKKIEIYDESGKIIKVVGGSYKGEVIRLKYMKGEALGHYENLDHPAISSTGYDCLYKACGASLGKSSMDLRRDIVSSMDRNPGAFSQMIFARNYLDSKPMGKARLMQGGYMEPKVDIAKYYMVGGEIVRDEGLGTELHRPDMKTLKERGEEISKQFEEFAGEGYDRARAFVRGLDEVGQTLLLSIIPAEKLFHYGFTGIKIVKDLKLVATLFPKIKKQYDIYTGNHKGLTREARNELAKIFIKGNRKDILKGLKGEGFKLAEKALDKIPQSLKDTNIFKPNSSGIGIKIGDKQNSIRIDKAVKKSRHGKILQTHEKIDHVKVIRNGQTIGRDGNVIKETKQYPNTSKNPESHIPLKEWLNWKSGLEK
jgi:hypothetical protein